MATSSECQLPSAAVCARLSPDRSNALVAYGCQDGNIHVVPFYGAESSQSRLEGLSAPVSAVGFNPMQSLVIGGSEAGAVQLWDLATEKSVKTFAKRHGGAVTSIDVHQSGFYIATASADHGLHIWDSRKSPGLVQSYKRSPAPLTCARFSPNGRWIASGSTSGAVRLHDLTSGKLVSELALHTGAITSLQFHPERYYLSVGSTDGTVSLWNLENFKHEFQSAPGDEPVDSVGFCGKKMFTASPGVLRLYDPLRLCERTTEQLQAPWGVVADAGYTAFLEELWYVQCTGTTAVNGRLPLDEAPPAAPVAKPSNYSKGSATAAASRSTDKRAVATASPPRRTPPARHSASPPSAAAASQGLVVDAFSCGPSFASIQPGGASLSDAEALQHALRCSPAMRSLLAQRRTRLHDFRTEYARQPADAIAAARTLVCDEAAEGGFVLDVLTAMQTQRLKERIPLGAVGDMSDVLATAMQSADPELQLCAVRLLRSLNTKFRARMEEARRRERNQLSNGGDNNPLRVDTAAALARLQDAISHAESLAGCQGSVGDEARGLLRDLPSSAR